MGTQLEQDQFFAMKEGEPHKVHMNGQKLAFSNLPKEMQDTIRKRLAEKDDVMARGLKGILPGIKIDGKEVTKDNIKDFEIDKMSEPKKQEPKVAKVTKYTKADLNKLTFTQLKKIGAKFDVTDRSKVRIIREILEAQ